MRLAEPEKTHLLLNSFHLSSPHDNPFRIVEVIQRASVPIIGVVPYDSGAEKALAKGVPLAAEKKSAAGKAVCNIASRLLGDSVPLLQGVMARKRRFRFY